MGRIALDVDGVLADLMPAWLERTNPGRLVPITVADMDRWDFWAKFGIRNSQFYEELDACWEDWESIMPTEPDLAGSVALLGNAGEVDIVTARSCRTIPFVKLWLDRQHIGYERYVSVPAGTMKAGLDDYDVFIDDSPTNAEEFLRRGRKVILYTQPWNVDVRQQSPNMTRVSTLAEAARIIHSFT